MSEPLHDIDRLFHDNIEDHSEYPPKKVWDKIEAGLDKNSAVIYKKKYQALKRAAIILLVLFLGILLYELAGRYPGKEGLAGANKENERHENTANHDKDNISGNAEKDDNDAPDQEKKIIVQSPVQQNDLSTTEKKNLPGDPSRIVLPVDPNNSVVRKNTGNNEQLKYNKTTTGKKDQSRFIVKQVGRQNQFDLRPNIVSPDKKKTTDSKMNELGEIKTVSDNETNLSESTKRSFTLITPGDLSKVITNEWSPSLTIPADGSASVLSKLVYPKARKSSNPLFRNYGFSVSAYFSPNLDWNSIEDDKPYRPVGSSNSFVDHDEIKKSERNSFSYTAGIKLGYGISKRVSLQTGFNYTERSTKVRPKYIYAEQDNSGNINYRFDCSSGYTYIPPHSGTAPIAGDKITLTDNRNILSYLGIPLAVEYRLSFGKFSLAVSGGAQVNFLLKGKTSVVLGKGTSGETSISNATEGLKSNYFSAITSITGELLLNRRLSVTIAPSGQFGLSSINSGAPVKTRPNYVGLATGLKWRL